MSLNAVGSWPDQNRDIFGVLRTHSYITIIAADGSVSAKYMVKKMSPWSERGGKLYCALELSGPHAPQLFLVKEGPLAELQLVDADGQPFPPLSQTIQVDTFGAETAVRSSAEMKQVLEQTERMQQAMTVHDQTGRKLGTVFYDPQTRDIRQVRTEPYENPDQQAEHDDELVYCTDAEGRITDDRLTRKQAREQGKRYLVVTSLMYHDDHLLLQRRSPKKTIDPDALSSSAHGVAKQLFTAEGKLIKDLRFAALVNTALEVNEELRHGAHTTPFTLKVWPGSERELLAYLYEEKMNDPETIYLVAPVVHEDDGYPLWQRKHKRTRFLVTGHVASAQPPSLTIDPAEVSAVQWCSLEQFLSTEHMTADIRACVEDTFEQRLLSRGKRNLRHNPRWVRRQIQRLFGSGDDTLREEKS